MIIKSRPVLGGDFFDERYELWYPVSIYELY